MTAVETSLDAARATGGLFDPTLRHELVRIGYNRPFDEIGAAQTAAGRPPGGRRLAADRRRPLRRGRHATERSGLDLGEIAKGMAVDASLELLAGLGIEAALVTHQGVTSRCSVVRPASILGGARVGADPEGPVVPLVRGALATSGIARRRWMPGEASRHHFVDPRTGEPATSGLCEVTVAGDIPGREVGATAAFVAGLLGPGLLKPRPRRPARHGVRGAARVGRWPWHEVSHAA